MPADHNAEFTADSDTWPDDLPLTLPFPRGRHPAHEAIREHASEYPDAPAVTYYGRTLTWSAFNDAIDAFAGGLCARGHTSTDVCAIYLQNSPQFLIAYHGAHRAGLTVTPANPQLRATALERQLSDSDAAIIVAHTDLLETARPAARKAGTDDIVTVEYQAFAALDESEIPVHEIVRGESTAPSGLDTVASLAEHGATPADKEPSLDDRALLQYTGGTTGLPKGCIHTHWNVLFKAATTTTVRQYDETDVLLGVMPTFHVAGKQRYCDTIGVAGCHVVLLARYTPEAVLAAIDAHGVTSTWLSVSAVEELLDHPGHTTYDLTSLSSNREFTNCSSFGLTLTREVSNAWHDMTGTVLQESGYGLTETHTTDTHTYGSDSIEPGFVGIPCYGVDIEIRDFESGEPVPTEEQGEIVLSTPSTMVEYLGQTDATEEVVEPDGFLHTGDVGRLTEDGSLYFLGRRKDAIKVSGHTVAPREVELVVKNCPLVVDAVVVGAPDDKRGAVLEAHVVPADGSVAEAEILEYLKPLLAEFKQPKRVVFRESFPRTDVGKIDRVSYYETLPDRYQ